MQTSVNEQPGTREPLETLRATLASQLRHLRSQLDELESGALYRARRAARAADLSVRSHPYRVIAVAAALGLLAGVIIARR